MNILEKEFVHIGTNKIYKDLWQNIRMDQSYNLTKPYGGLYCSNQNTEICDWLSYVETDLEEGYEYFSNLPGCLIKLKTDANVLILNNKEDIENLKNNNLIRDLSNNPLIIDKYYYQYTITFLPKYEEISNIYDAIYINPYIDNAFKQYSIPTLLITNPNAIEYYKPIIMDKESIINVGNKEYINELTLEYYDYYKYIKDLFYDINTENYEEYIKILNILRDNILRNKDNLYTNLNFSINNNIDAQNLLETITHNIYREKYLLKQKVLHK